MTPQDTVFDFATPAIIDSADPSSTEVGVKFSSELAGTVTGIRFYKATTNTGTHIGSLWSSTGTLLASATFTSETESGWQTVNFSTPVTINPNTTYVAAYLAPKGHYSDTPLAFSSAGVSNPPLQALANIISPDGVFSHSVTSTFPTGTFNATNYWVDVTFVPTPVPGQVTNVNATPGPGSANVNWSAPSNGGPVTTYTITPYIGSSPQTTTTVTGSPPATGTTIQGLTSGTSYTFIVQASNANGSGPASEPSNAVTPSSTAPPSAPTGVSATAATSQALVSWNASTNEGGSTITGYTVIPYIGSTAQTLVHVGPSATTATVPGLSNGTSYTFTVTAVNEIGESPPSSASNQVIPQDTIFDFASPTTIDSGDGSSTEVGVKFTSEVFGLITGIRFYKATTNTGTHIGSLWSSTGTLLASATFTNETASGWQQVTFSTPVTVNANTTYVAGYLAPKGHYSDTSAAFASVGASNPPLSALANSVSADGVFSHSVTSTFPTNTFNATNYWVDVELHARTGARSGHKRERNGGQWIGKRQLERAIWRRTGHDLHDHPLYRLRSAVRYDRDGFAPGDGDNRERADQRHLVYLYCAGIEPHRRRARLRTVQRRYAHRGLSSVRAYRRDGHRGDEPGAGHLERSRQQRRERHHRLHRDPIYRL